MPLFESQTKRNARLFKGAFEFFAQRVSEQEWNGRYQAMHIAWLAGGSSAANYIVDHCQDVATGWRKGDDRLACKLTQVFSLAVIPRFVRWEPGMTGESQQARRSLIKGGM
ncbi:MAG: hypothetical protein ABIU97_06415, partial [Dehalococcoidia bacterium]